MIQVDSKNNSDMLLPLAIITDMDSKTKQKDSWYSTLRYGALAFSQVISAKEKPENKKNTFNFRIELLLSFTG